MLRRQVFLMNIDLQCATKAPVSLVAESATGKVQTKYISYRALSTQRQRSVLSVGREVVGRKRKLKWLSPVMVNFGMADGVEKPEGKTVDNAMGVVHNVPGVGEHGMQPKWAGERGRS